MICKDISSSVSDCNCAILLIRKSDIISFLVGLSLGGGGWPRGGERSIHLDCDELNCLKVVNIEGREDYIN